jgi:putative membrane protein
VFVFYSFVSLEVIAEEIENPFGTDPNDLPINELTDKIRHNVNSIFRQ